jgi:hypothetical protein
VTQLESDSIQGCAVHIHKIEDLIAAGGIGTLEGISKKYFGIRHDQGLLLHLSGCNGAKNKDGDSKNGEFTHQYQSSGR